MHGRHDGPRAPGSGRPPPAARPAWRRSGYSSPANPPPRTACTRVTNSVSCSLLSPVIASYRNGSSVLISLSGRQRNKTAGAVAPQGRHAPFTDCAEIVSRLPLGELSDLLDLTLR